MAEVFPNLWYDNAIKDNTYTLSGLFTEYAGFEWVNASDWRDFSEFKWLPLNASTVFVTCTTAKTLSAFIMWPSSIPEATLYRVYAELGASGGGYTQLTTMTMPANATAPIIVTFDPVLVKAGNKFTIERGTGAVSDHVFRQIFVGDKLTLERGMYNGVKPPTLSGSIVTDTVISANGSILGRNVRRVDRAQNLDFSPVTQYWVRGTWEKFVTHMQRYACFYQWNPTTFPSEIVFAGAEQINAPDMAPYKGYMKVSMPLRCLS